MSFFSCGTCGPSRYYCVIKKVNKQLKTSSIRDQNTTKKAAIAKSCKKGRLPTPTDVLVDMYSHGLVIVGSTSMSAGVGNLPCFTTFQLSPWFLCFFVF